MTVEISVNWHFIAEGGDFALSFSTGHIELGEERDDVPAEEDFPFMGVVPQTSSVLAPGLSMPLAAH